MLPHPRRGYKLLRQHAARRGKPRRRISGGSGAEEGHRMQALCKYCRAMTTPAPSHPGRPRLCSNCFTPISPVGRPCAAALGSTPVHTRGMARTEPPVHRPSPSCHCGLLRHPCLRERPSSGPAPAVTTTRCASRRLGWRPSARISVLGTTGETVHLAPQKQNACSARLRQQDHGWRPSPWVASTPTPVTRQYQARCCLEAYVGMPLFPSSRDTRGTDYKRR